MRLLHKDHFYTVFDHVFKDLRNAEVLRVAPHVENLTLFLVICLCWAETFKFDSNAKTKLGFGTRRAVCRGPGQGHGGGLSRGL